MPALDDLLDEVDRVVESESAEDAARIFGRHLVRRLKREHQEALCAHLRAHGFVVRPDEQPPVQVPGVYDPDTLAAEVDDLLGDLSGEPLSGPPELTEEQVAEIYDAIRHKRAGLGAAGYRAPDLKD